jgi:predicted Zn-dependent protease
VSQLPDDPYLLYSTEVHSSEKTDASQLPDSPGVIARIVESVRGLDMVGIYAAGGMMRGFANSFGQKNWFETYSFHLDWSFYLRADKAVKSSYAGLRWNDHEFVAKVDRARLQWEVLKREPRTIEPGRYRVYLSPSAIEELTGVMSWGGFGLKSHKTKQTPLMKLADGTHPLHPSVTLREHTQGGLSPDFNEFGYVKPSVVTLIENGVYKDCLVSPRSAVEYDVPTNGAGTGEIPQSLEMISGDLAMEDAEVALGEGVYVNNLWYLNFSDRSAGRVTGMTRFATFWVEGGKISQPLNVMRFDESLIKLFGENLLSLTKERELLLSASTYGHRTTDSSHLPGALVKDFSFTL